MSKRNVTLAIEEELLAQAREVAARQRTSVNEMVRRHLEQLVSGEQRRREAWERVRRFVEEPPLVLGGPLPPRDEIHAR